MIVVDSSAFIAILEQEPEAAAFLSAIEAAPRRLASAVNATKSVSSSVPGAARRAPTRS